MNTVILIMHIIVSVSLMALILLQSSQGGFGGNVASAGMYRNKRGAERIIFSATIILSIAFFTTAIMSLLIR